MNNNPENNRPDWLSLLERIKRDVSALSETDRAWLRERIAQIEVLQIELDKLFLKTGGLDACADCDGSCCGCGRHHVTLTNLLAYLLADEEPPVPDLNCTCPYLGNLGCRLPVGRRPYNCITFFCETLETRLDPDECTQLRTLDQQLRSEYQRVAERYPAASLRGLWIAMERLGEGRILRRNDQDVLG